MLAFSTCWNSSRHTDGEAMIEEILDLGFNAVELSHGFKVSLLPGVKKLLDAGRVSVVGVHNFFPSPLDVASDSPDCVELTSFRKADRDRALKLSLKSLEEAAKLGAGYVVMHMGSVAVMNRKKGTGVLERMALDGLLPSQQYADFKEALVRKRRKDGALYFRRAQAALHALVDKAAECGVKLCIEARSHYEQVPDEEEMPLLLEEFKDHPYVGYWHDFGHVQRKHHLQLINHQQVFDRMLPYLAGAHVNDVRWPAADHKVPFCGGVDFAGMIPKVDPSLPLVWELSRSRTADDIRNGLSKWRNLFPNHV